MKSKKGPFKMKKLSAFKFPVSTPGISVGKTGLVKKIPIRPGGMSVTRDNYTFSSGGRDPHTRMLLDRARQRMQNRPKRKAKKRGLVSRILGAFGL